MDEILGPKIRLEEILPQKRRREVKQRRLLDGKTVWIVVIEWDIVDGERERRRGIIFWISRRSRWVRI